MLASIMHDRSFCMFMSVKSFGAQIFDMTAGTAQATPPYPITQPPPPILPKFDASMPPPPIPTNVKAKKTPLNKLSPSSFDAQPKKVRKLEEEKAGLCDQCIQRDIRVKSYKQEMDKLCSEEEYQTLIYKKKLEEYQNRKELLRSLVSNDLFRLIEDYVEAVPQLQVHDVLSQLHQSSFVSGTSSAPKSFLLQLMEFVLENSRVDSVPSSLLQNLSRRQSSVSMTSPDVMQTFVDIIQQSNSSERIRAEEMPSSTSNTAATNGSNNGLHRFPNGQKAEPAPIRPPPPAHAPPLPPTLYPAPPARMYYPPPFPVPAGVSMSRAPPPPAPATAPPPPAPTPAPPSCLSYATAMYQPPYYQRHQ